MCVTRYKAALLVLLICVLSVPLFAEISKNDAEDLVLNQILVKDIGKIDVYVSNNTISSIDGLQLWNDEAVSCPYTGNWVFFVDDMPFANWYHPCRYIFVDTETGGYQIVDHSIYPENYENEFELIAEMSRPEPINLTTNPESTLESREPNEHLYAVIINGCDWERYWNDVSAIYCTLIDVYGYTKDNIIVHYTYGPGTSTYGDDLDGDDIHDDIDFNAYKTTIYSTFENLYNTLGRDDQLFVFVDDHGNGDGDGHSWVCLPGDDLHDYELASYVENIRCSQMIFVMEPCLVGGFLDDLSDYENYDVQCKNRAIHTACNDHESSWSELWITGADYDEFVFYWTAAARGFFPGDHPWELGYSVIEFPFDNYFTAGTTHPDPYDPDINGDGFVQMEEAFDYSNNFDTWSPYGYYNTSNPNYPQHQGTTEHPDSFHDIGFQEDLLSLYGICGNVVNPQTITGNFMINPSLTIEIGDTLTVDDSSRFYVIEDASVTLCERSVLEIKNNSHLRFYEGSSLYGTEHTVWVDPATGKGYDSWQEAYEINHEIGAEDEIPGDRVVVNNSLLKMSGSAANPVTITSVGDGWWDGIEIHNCNSYPGNMGISCCDVSKIGHIKVNNSRFGLSNLTYSHCGQISAVNNSYLSIQECLIDSISACPIYCCESKVSILNSTIQNNGGKGIYVYLPSDSLNAISANTIISNGEWGVQVIDAPIYCINNNITDNSSHGFVSYGAAGTPILAGNTIANNGGIEIVGLHQWPDMTSLVGSYGANTVYSQDNGGTDHYLLGTSVQGSDCRGNNIDLSDHTRFLPSFSYYIFDGEDSEERILYASAVEDISEEEYESAKTTMTEIVDDYPETDTAISALQWLLYLENFSGNDYAGLRAYAETIDDVSYPNLERIKNKVITSTYMCEKDYLTSIDRLEDVIADPPSVEDSILALINEGYCYLKLEEEGGKAAPVKCTFKPRSFDEFSYISQNLTDNLLYKPVTEPPETGTHTMEFVLQQNYPNPTSLSTTFSFSIPANTNIVELKIYNLKGQLVKTFQPDTINRGTTNEITWDCKDDNGKTLRNGIYFYKLTADKNEIVKKMILMR